MFQHTQNFHLKKFNSIDENKWWHMPLVLTGSVATHTVLVKNLPACDHLKSQWRQTELT